MTRPTLDYRRDLNIADPLTPEQLTLRLGDLALLLAHRGRDEALVELAQLRYEMGALLPAHDPHDHAHPVARSYDGLQDAIRALAFPPDYEAALRHLRGVVDQVALWEDAR